MITLENIHGKTYEVPGNLTEITVEAYQAFTLWLKGNTPEAVREAQGAKDDTDLTQGRVG